MFKGFFLQSFENWSTFLPQMPLPWHSSPLHLWTLAEGSTLKNMSRLVEKTCNMKGWKWFAIRLEDAWSISTFNFSNGFDCGIRVKLNVRIRPWISSHPHGLEITVNWIQSKSKCSNLGHFFHFFIFSFSQNSKSIQKWLGSNLFVWFEAGKNRSSLPLRRRVNTLINLPRLATTISKELSLRRKVSKFHNEGLHLHKDKVILLGRVDPSLQIYPFI